MKLIKLTDTHYIIVDDSEKKEGDFVYHPEVSQEYTIVNPLKEGDEKYSKGQHIAQGIYRHKPTTNEWYKKEKKITHSTQPLDRKCLSCNGEDECIECITLLKPLSLAEVEEAIYGYSVEKMALEYDGRMKLDVEFIRAAFKGGFNKHKELTKDKLFTIEDIFDFALEYTNYLNKCTASNVINPSLPNEYFNNPFDIKNRKFTKQSLLPKTQWDCCISDDKLVIL